MVRGKMAVDGSRYDVELVVENHDQEQGKDHKDGELYARSDL